jgi:hypothetical protein
VGDVNSRWHRKVLTDPVTNNEINGGRVARKLYHRLCPRSERIKRSFFSYAGHRKEIRKPYVFRIPAGEGMHAIRIIFKLRQKLRERSGMQKPLPWRLRTDFFRW